MKLLESLNKKYYKMLSSLSQNKRFKHIKYFRYFKNFWVHAVQKELYELDTRYYNSAIDEKSLYLKLKKLFDNKIVIPFLDLSVCTTCTLNCRDCTQWIPYIKNKKIFSAESIITNLENLFQYVDYIHFISPLGGEPFLNKEIDTILEYLIQKSNDGKIGYIRLVTNGTIFPDENILKYFHHPKLSLLISNYDKALNNNAKENKLKLIDYFEKNKLKYFLPEGFNWIDLGTPQELKQKNTEQLRETFNTCFIRNCISLFDGVLYRCPRAYAIAELFPPPRKWHNEYIKISEIKSKHDMRKKLKNFYTIDYLDACNYCVNNEDRIEIESAIQL